MLSPILDKLTITNHVWEFLLKIPHSNKTGALKSV